MAKEIENDDGTKETYYSPAEVEAQKAEAATAATAEKEAEVAAKTAEVERLNKHIAEQSGNFKKLKDMTEAEKATLTTAEIESRTRAEKTEAELEALKNSIDTDKKAAAEAAETAIIKKYCGDDKELQEKFKKNMGIVNVADLEERAAAAAAISGITTSANGKMNPLHVPLHGASPEAKKQQDEKKEFLESDKAKAALAAMGDAPTAAK